MNTKNKATIVQDLGLISFEVAWKIQEKLLQEIIQIKVKNREYSFENQEITPNYILICQHPHVYTLGKSGNGENLLANEERLSQIGAELFNINRGGDITYHGPGQLVVYPILDLDNFFTDIHKYLRCLEEAVIRTINEFGIEGERSTGFTGVWIRSKEGKESKICAMGVRTSRWVTMHGLALNVNTDLSYFNNIVPCGIADKPVTSMQNEKRVKIDFEEVKNTLVTKLAEVFDMELIFQ